MSKDFTRPCYALHLALEMGVTILDQTLTTIYELHAVRMPEYYRVGNPRLYQAIWKRISDNPPREYLYYSDDSTGLSYLALGIWEDRTLQYVVVIGPFLSSPVTTDWVLEHMQRYRYPSVYQNDLERYLKSIPYKRTSIMAIGEIACTIFRHPLDDCELSMTVEDSHVSYNTINEAQKLLLKDLYASIQTQYQVESRLRQAIRAGDLSRALEINNQFPISFHYRMPGNIMRIEKNTSYSFSTIMRLAALEGGVRPITAHLISEHFTHLIERAKTPNDIVELQTQMINSYCKAVQDDRLQGLSEVVRHAVSYIQCYYDEPISLHSVANAISFHPSYLAKTFRKEMGQTVVSYINQLRIAHVLQELPHCRASITDIALQAGFNSYSYFTTVFKKITGVSCREYVKQLPTAHEPTAE